MTVSITTTCRDIGELNPVAQEACKLFLEECQKAGIDIFITETYRSQARQNYLYEQGRSRPGNKVTWTKSSNHTGRMAWDIAVSPPKSLYDTATLNKAGAIAKRLGITWGGDWTGTPDKPHFEVKSTWKAPKTTSAASKPKEDRKISFFTGGYSGESLLKIHNFLVQKGYYFKPTRNDGGSLSFEIGEFTDGTPKAKEMENFLKSINAWYQIK